MKQLTTLVLVLLLSASVGFSSSNASTSSSSSIMSDVNSHTLEAELSSMIYTGVSQTIRVTGTVVDAMNGEALPGANVMVSGTTIGVTTNLDGMYSINVPNENAILVVTFIGYLTEEIPVGSNQVINVSLIPDIQALEEIVVVGYGVMRKALVTGATSHMGSDEIQKSHSLRLEQSLRGRAAGVHVTTSSGQPGEDLKVRIRGVGTVGNNEPLYIVDGIPTSSIVYLNPNDIQSIDILKDAASAAIYGARAANGVVLITTKTGQKGRLDVTYDGYYGVQNPMKKLDMLDAQQYAMIMNEARANSGDIPLFSEEQISQLGRGTDWQDHYFNYNAPIQNHSIGMSGGSEKSVYSASFAYTTQEGIAGKKGMSNYERVTARINSSHGILEDKVTIGQNLMYSNTNRQGINIGNIYENSIRGFLNAPPTLDAYDPSQPDGFGRSDVFDFPNPLALMHYGNFRRTQNDRILASVFSEISLFKGFKFRTSYGVDLDFETFNAFTPEYELSSTEVNPFSRAEQSLSRSNTWIWENTITYDFDLGLNSFTVLAGTSAQENNYFSVYGRKEDLIIPDFDYAILDNATNDESQLARGHRTEHALSSIFARINYNFDEKYLLSATVRRDGSTRFGSNNRYGIFPSVSAGWNMHQEQFMTGIAWLNMLKVRGSWGQNGNENIEDFRYMSTINSRNRNYPFGVNDDIYTGSSIDRLPNPDLKWETSEQINIGFDSRILGSLDINFDWYRKTTKDWLLDAPIPAFAGFDAPFINGGVVENKGVELVVSYRSKSGDLSYGVSGNVAYNKNEVIDISNEEKVIHGEPNAIFHGISQQYRTEVGYPVGYFWGLETDGIFQTQEEINNYINNDRVVQPRAEPGDMKFVDRNGDGVIDREDYTMIGKFMPDYTFGLSFDADYKGFDFSILMNGVYGNQIIMGLRGHARAFHNYTTDILDRWNGPGSSNTMPRVVSGTDRNWRVPSDLHLQEGSFLRIGSVNFGYNFKELLPVLPVQQFRLYVSALNLHTFTKYPGYDPEVGYGPEDYVAGFDIGFYQQPRTFLVGLNVKF